MKIVHFWSCLYNRRETKDIPAKVYHWRWGFTYDGHEVEAASGHSQDYFTALGNIIDSMGIWGAWKEEGGWELNGGSRPPAVKPVEAAGLPLDSIELDNIKENSDAH